MLHEAKPFIECATYLKANGAKNVIIMVTHAIFYGDTIQLIEKSCIDHVITSNSVNFQDHLKNASKVLCQTNMLHIIICNIYKYLFRFELLISQFSYQKQSVESILENL